MPCRHVCRILWSHWPTLLKWGSGLHRGVNIQEVGLAIEGQLGGSTRALLCLVLNIILEKSEGSLNAQMLSLTTSLTIKPRWLKFFFKFLKIISLWVECSIPNLLWHWYFVLLIQFLAHFRDFSWIISLNQFFLAFQSSLGYLYLPYLIAPLRLLLSLASSFCFPCGDLLVMKFPPAFISPLAIHYRFISCVLILFWFLLFSL